MASKTKYSLWVIITYIIVTYLVINMFSSFNSQAYYNGIIIDKFIDTRYSNYYLVTELQTNDKIIRGEVKISLSQYYDYEVLDNVPVMLLDNTIFFAQDYTFDFYSLYILFSLLYLVISGVFYLVLRYS